MGQISSVINEAREATSSLMLSLKMTVANLELVELARTVPKENIGEQKYQSFNFDMNFVMNPADTTPVDQYVGMMFQVDNIYKLNASRAVSYNEYMKDETKKNDKRTVQNVKLGSSNYSKLKEALAANERAKEALKLK